MAVRRRLLIALLAIILLVCVYIMYLMCWPLKHLHDFTKGKSSGSKDTKQLLDRQSNSDQWSPPPPASIFHPELSSGTVQHEHTRATRTSTLKTQTLTGAKQQKPAENKVNIRSDAVDKTRPSIKHLVMHQLDRTQEDQSKDSSFIGDVYVIEENPPQTHCPDSIQSRVAKTEFGGRFLKDIPILQWAKHVAPQMHKNLSKYPGAHGWGNIDYKTLEETLSVLNSTANWQMLDDWSDHSNKPKCAHCAVVGNGGILKDSKKGKDIDSHHYVFRTNGAIIKGFEEDVGSRTTHYTFSTNTLMNSMRSYAKVGFKGPPLSDETRYVFLPDHDRDYLLMKAAATHTLVDRGPEGGKDPAIYFGQDVSKEKVKMYHPDFIRYLRNRFLRSNAMKTKYKDIYRPSTGAVMLLAAMHICDQVSAYGFMTPDYKNYSDHYYDSSYHPVGFFINHDLKMEMNLWQQLHKAGLIQLYMHK